MSQRPFQRFAARLLRGVSRVQPSDAELLARFTDARDECAFAELVARHGGLVRGISRRYVRDSHIAEDVFQAAFLVLAQKAGAGHWGPTVGPWLHSTTLRIARKALYRMGPPSAPPVEVASGSPEPVTIAAWGEVCRTLDEELAAMPASLRGPLVLCYLEGCTRDEAAHLLGCSLAKLKRRLERGRNIFRDRLTHRGVSLPAAGVGVLACDLVVDAATVEETARAAVAFVASGTAAPGASILLGAVEPAFTSRRRYSRRLRSLWWPAASRSHTSPNLSKRNSPRRPIHPPPSRHRTQGL